MMESDQGRLLLPGQQLRKAREARGLSEVQIAERMHLSVSYIRALEADNYAKLPEAAFIRGYIRNYAKLVSLPGDELANLFQQIVSEQAPADPSPSLIPVNEGRDRRSWWIAGAVGLVLAVWLLWPSSVQTPVERPVEQPAEPEWPQEIDEEELELPEQGAESQAAIELASSPAGPVADRLEIRFSEDCWLRVRDVDGDEIYVGQRTGNQPLLLEGRGPFRITLGNAAAVSAIMVNDASVRVPTVAPGQVITVRAP
ncbi:MAG: RodZ domain-containing protein [Alcanivoracaceae bacterium]